MVEPLRITVAIETGTVSKGMRIISSMIQGYWYENRMRDSVQYTPCDEH